jgi:hypothetical protein
MIRNWPQWWPEQLFDPSKDMKCCAISLLVLCAGLFSCEITDDPRAGGYFSYMELGEGAYQNRIQQREAALGGIQSDTNAVQASNNSLENRKGQLGDKIARLQSLRTKSQGLSGSVSLRGRISALEQNAENTPNLDVRVRQLEQEYNSLKAQNDALR